MLYPPNSDNTLKLKSGREDGASPVGQSAITMDLTIAEEPESATVMRPQEPSQAGSARDLVAVDKPTTAPSGSRV